MLGLLGDPKKKVESALEGLALSKRVRAFTDAFRNVMTGIGTSRSKLAYGEYVPDPILDFYTLESLYESNDLAETIVGKIVEDALRAPFTFKTHDANPDDDRDDVKAVMDRWRQLGGTQHVLTAGQLGRLKGAAGVILAVKGGGALSAPLDDETITELVKLIDWDAEDMTEFSWYPDGSCETYMWNPPPQGGPTPAGVIVHETRLVKFPGAKTTARGRRRSKGWDQSVLQRVVNALRSFDGMFASTDAMFSDASQRIFKLKGLIASLAEADGSGALDVTSRLQMLDMQSSVNKAIMLDAGDETGNGEEDYSVIDRPTLGTLDGVMQVYLIRLAAAARMPLTVLLGMSPAGMDATGESDMILWFNSVDTYRRLVLEERILRLVRIVARSLGIDASTWEIEWPELARPKPLDVRTAEQMNVQSAVQLIEAQVLVPEEVALSLPELARTGISGIVLDVKSRKKRLQDALGELEDGELGLAKIEAEAEAVAKSKPAPAGAQAGNKPKMSERKTPSKTAKKQHP